MTKHLGITRGASCHILWLFAAALWQNVMSASNVTWLSPAMFDKSSYYSRHRCAIYSLLNAQGLFSISRIQPLGNSGKTTSLRAAACMCKASLLLENPEISLAMEWRSTSSYSLRRLDRMCSVKAQRASSASQFRQSLLTVQALHSISMHTLVMHVSQNHHICSFWLAFSLGMLMANALSKGCAIHKWMQHKSAC